MLLIAATAVVGIAGITVAHFWTALVLLGFGWNLSFIGATTMVTQCHRPHERNKVQAFNDFLIFGSMALSSFSSGQLLDKFGWTTINEVIFPTIFVTGALLVWLALRPRAGGGLARAPGQAEPSVSQNGRGDEARASRANSALRIPQAFWLYPRAFRSG